MGLSNFLAGLKIVRAARHGRGGNTRARFRPVALLGALLFGVVPAALAAAPESEPAILAVHPYLPATEVVARFTPLADYLARELGRPVRVRVGRDYEEHIEAIGKDRVDIAFMGPAPYVKLVERYGKKPTLARIEVNGQPYLRGVIVVRADSPVQGLSGLKGRRVAFGDPDSTMSHLVPQYMLEKAGVPLRTLSHHRFLGAHKNVALAVLAGDFDAGAVKEEIYREYAPQGLRALATSPPVADHLFVARSDLPAAEVERLRAALLRLKDAPGGAAIMDSIHKGMTAMVGASDTDYDSLRTILRSIESGRR